MSVDGKAAKAFESSRISPPVHMPYDSDMSRCPVNYSARLRECLADREDEMGAKQIGYSIDKLIKLLEANHHTGAVSFCAVVDFLIYVSHGKHTGAIRGLVRSSLNPFHDNSWIKQDLINERLDQARDAYLDWLEGQSEFEEITYDEALLVLNAFVAKCGVSLARTVLSRFQVKKLGLVKPAHRGALLAEFKAEDWAWVLS